MIELKAWVKSLSEMSRNLRREISRLAVKDRLGIAASTQGARFQSSTPAQRQAMIRQLLSKFDTTQQNRIIERWIRAEQARGRLQSQRDDLSRELREYHLARMFLKGTPLNIVEDPKYTHPRDPKLMGRVWEIAYGSRGDLVMPDGFNGTKRQWFRIWWDRGHDPNGRPEQARPPKRPYQPGANPQGNADTTPTTN